MSDNLRPVHSPAAHEVFGEPLTDAERIAVLYARAETVTVKVPLSEEEMKTLLWAFNGWLRQMVEDMPIEKLVELFTSGGGIPDRRQALLRAFGVEP